MCLHSHSITLHLYFFFNDTATTEIYTLSLHDALPIRVAGDEPWTVRADLVDVGQRLRSEEHTSELQSPYDLVCRLLIEKKKKKSISILNETHKNHTKKKKHYKIHE